MQDNLQEDVKLPEMTPQEYIDHVIMLEMKVRELKALVEYDEYLEKFNQLKNNNNE